LLEAMGMNAFVLVVVAGASAAARADDGSSSSAGLDDRERCGSIAVRNPCPGGSTADGRCGSIAGPDPCPDGSTADGRSGSLAAAGLFVQLGATRRAFTSPVAQVAMRADAPGTGSGTADVLALDQRVGIAVSDVVYAAVDLELGNFGVTGARTAGFAIDGLVALGARGRLGPLSPAVELASGAGGLGPVGGARWLVEGRARVDLWITPWLTIGGTYGAGLLERERVAGMLLGVYGRPHGGMR
jgi:hypothetical protein